MKYNQILKIKNGFGKTFFALIVVFALTAAVPGRAEPGTAIKPGTSQAKGLKSDSLNEGAAEVLQTIIFNRDVNTTDALQFLGVKYRKNIVPSQKVGGIITVTKLADVTFEEAMDAVLGHNYKYEYEGNLVKVYTADEYRKIKADKSRMIHKVFTLYYINAQEAKKLIDPLLSDSAVVAASSASEAGTEAGGGGDSLAMRDRLVIYDYPENITKIEEMMEHLDVNPAQILIEVTILEADLTEATELGIDLNTLSGVSIDSIANIAAGTAEGITTGGFASGVTTGGLSVGIVMDKVSAFIRALESVTDTTVLANPKILALNKQAGQILIGNRDGYITTTISETQSTQTVEFLETGTKLKFRPFVCKDGYIRMEINPESSDGSVKVKGTYLVPETSTTEVKTNVMVKDGKTIVIGGLFREKTESKRSQVPMLGDLPFIGAAFRKTTDESVRKELIILITPHIISEPEQTHPDERIGDIDRIRHSARQAMQWPSRPSRAEYHYANSAKYYTEDNLEAALVEVNLALDLRPTYLEAIRLREKIIRQASPDDAEQMERIMLGIIEKEESHNWLRR